MGRAAAGVRGMNLAKGDAVTRMLIVKPGDEILIMSKSGTMSRQKTDAISCQGRGASGVRVQRLDEKDKVVDVARVIKQEDIEEQKAALQAKEDKEAKKEEAVKDEEKKTEGKKAEKKKGAKKK